MPPTMATSDNMLLAACIAVPLITINACYYLGNENYDEFSEKGAPRSMKKKLASSQKHMSSQEKLQDSIKKFSKALRLKKQGPFKRMINKLAGIFKPTQLDTSSSPHANASTNKIPSANSDTNIYQDDHVNNYGERRRDIAHYFNGRQVILSDSSLKFVGFYMDHYLLPETHATDGTEVRLSENTPPTLVSPAEKTIPKSSIQKGSIQERTAKGLVASPIKMTSGNIQKSVLSIESPSRTSGSSTTKVSSGDRSSCGKATAVGVNDSSTQDALPIIKPLNHSIKCQGFTNVNNSSCFIASVLTALFYSSTLYDKMLIIPVKDKVLSEAQNTLVNIINTLREGHLVTGTMMHKFMTEIEGYNRINQSFMEASDVDEFYSFLQKYFGAFEVSYFIDEPGCRGELRNTIEDCVRAMDSRKSPQRILPINVNSTQEVEIPRKLMFVKPKHCTCGKDEEYNVELISGINFMEAVEIGHYFAYVKSQASDMWWKFNDFGDKVTETDEDSTMKDLNKRRHTLFYAINSKCRHNPEPDDCGKKSNDKFSLFTLIKRFLYFILFSQHIIV
ncbi:hypothetical protein BDB01DRAFT_837499 [Pilobolus umbonatus]|nr:hypothetical protein BDB01DRAFT_837499 [Pilobolus umbonatus]